MAATVGFGEIAPKRPSPLLSTPPGNILILGVINDYGAFA
jgi:hypothetical protein